MEEFCCCYMAVQHIHSDSGQLRAVTFQAATTQSHQPLDWLSLSSCLGLLTEPHLQNLPEKYQVGGPILCPGEWYSTKKALFFGVIRCTFLTDVTCNTPGIPAVVGQIEVTGEKQFFR